MSELSIDELKTKEKIYIVIVIAFFAIFAFFAGVIIYGIENKGLTGIIVIPIAQLLFLFISYKYLNDIKSELKKRE